MICAHCGASQNHTENRCQECGKPALLQERYALLETIGQGAVGITYRALDTKNQQIVAIKELPWKPVGQDKRIDRLQKEARILQELNHEQIPKYYEHFVLKIGRHKLLYVIQEYISGPTLQEQIAQKRFLQTEIWSIAQQLLSILVYLQNLSPPIIHRDIKPSNVIFHPPSESYFLIDFGSVRDALSDPELGASTFAGTFGYMAPEQIHGHTSLSTDLYSLGAMITQLLCRKDPSQLLNDQLELDYSQYTSLSPPYRRFLGKLCAAKAKDRHNSAQEAYTHLQSILSPEKEIRALPPTTELLHTLRAVMREELHQYQDERQSQQPVSAPPTTIIIREPPQSKPLIDPPRPQDPLVATPQDLALPFTHTRRGWWKAKPPTPVEERKPLHIATQLLLMSGGVVITAVVIQLLFV